MIDDELAQLAWRVIDALERIADALELPQLEQRPVRPDDPDDAVLQRIAAIRVRQESDE